MSTTTASLTAVHCPLLIAGPAYPPSAVYHSSLEQGSTDCRAAIGRTAVVKQASTDRSAVEQRTTDCRAAIGRTAVVKQASTDRRAVEQLTTDYRDGHQQFAPADINAASFIAQPPRSARKISSQSHSPSGKPQSSVTEIKIRAKTKRAHQLGSFQALDHQQLDHSVGNFSPAQASAMQKLENFREKLRLIPMTMVVQFIAKICQAVYSRRMRVPGRNLLAWLRAKHWIAACCRNCCWVAIVVCVWGGWFVQCAGAAVAVISNRTQQEIKFSVIVPGGVTVPGGGAATGNSVGPGSGSAGSNGAVSNGGVEADRSQPKAYKIASGDLVTMPLSRGAHARLVASGVDCPIQADAAYYFGELPSGKISFDQIGIGEMPALDSRTAAALSLVPKRSPEADEAARTITVKIFVDEKEPATQASWERRLRDRVANASDILEHACGMKLKVIGAGTWNSDSSITKFEDAVAEFTRKADPGEARVAIGFTSQFQITHGRTHLGGTQALLSRHILLREWSQYVNEPERLELLVHELGHFLGAVHSPESDSVMRAILGDKQARVRKFQIHFDPLNELAMNLVAEQWQQRPPLRSPWEMPPQTRAQLSVIYAAIAQALPEDPAAMQYLRIMGNNVGASVTVGSQ